MRTLILKKTAAGPVTLSDPEGDALALVGLGEPPRYGAVNLSLSGTRLSGTYSPNPSPDSLCAAVRERGALEDTFTVVLRDRCGAVVEVPGRVHLEVVDQAPPKITVPAGSLTVECAGEATAAEFAAWLEKQGGAVAEETCCPPVTWSHRIDKYEPGCGKTGRYHVTFLASDCAGNEARTSATFTIVDTQPPQWGQPMPGDIQVECHEVPPPPEVTARDTCAGELEVRFREERIAGPCPHTYTLVRTWEATDGCHRISHTQRITVRDTTPPDLFVPGDVDLGCNPERTDPDVTGWATAQDTCDPDVRPTYTDHVSGEGCRVTIRRTWQAKDACGQESKEKTQRITYIQDQVPPQLTVPKSEKVEYPAVPPVGEATFTDNCDPRVQKAEYLGEERVEGACPCRFTLVRRWRAVDTCGNEARAEQVIEVQDTTPPQLVVPGDVDLGCNPPDTSPDATGWATATDACGVHAPPTYTDRVSEKDCWVTIERTWEARDVCGNPAAPRTQRITFIKDTEPPELLCPSSVSAYLYGCVADAVWVTFPISVRETCDPNPRVRCVPSGGWFGEGTTWVSAECWASDRCGNEMKRTCTFPVTVVRVNRPPVAPSYAMSCDGFCSITVAPYDPDGDPVQVVEARARCGTAWVVGNQVYYTTAGWDCPAPPGPGVTDTITYTVTDGCATSTGTITVYITCTICPSALPKEEP